MENCFHFFIKMQNLEILTGTIKSVNVSFSCHSHIINEIDKVYAGGSRFMFFYKLREGGSVKIIGNFDDLKYPGSKIEYRRTDLLN